MAKHLFTGLEGVAAGIKSVCGKILNSMHFGKNYSPVSTHNL
jgi:hypothetical protein